MSVSGVAPTQLHLVRRFRLQFLACLIHVFTGIIATFLLLTIVWFPEFMLGATEVRIQSSRAREVSGEEVTYKEGRAGEVSRVQSEHQRYYGRGREYHDPCEIEGCRGKGIVGSKCKEC